MGARISGKFAAQEELRQLQEVGKCSPGEHFGAPEVHDPSQGKHKKGPVVIGGGTDCVILEARGLPKVS